MKQETLLRVDNITLMLPKRILLENLSFSLQKGETLALVGESGSGKSLTALSIMRLLPEAMHIASGDILLNGTSLLAMPEERMQQVRGKRIVMIFQEPMSALNPVMEVGEQVAEVIRYHENVTPKEAKRRVLALFEEVALPDVHRYYHRYPHQLSGGQKQRVMIAMALACEPELLIADEPTTALDVTVQAQVLSVLKRIQQKRGVGMLFISHDMAVVSQVADKIGVMYQGRLVELALAKSLLANPQHPYTKKLLLAASIPMASTPSTTKVEPLLAVEHLCVHFKEKRAWWQKPKVVKAVDGVTFTLARGRTVAVVGESGSGKSTLGNAILSLVATTSGTIRYQGKVINRLSKSAFRPYRKKIQVIFQDPFASLDPRMRIEQILSEGMIALGVGGNDAMKRRAYLVKLLQEVELSADILNRYPHQLSGGQRQRIGIARALAVEPELIICDEPTSALDVSVRTEVLRLLHRLQQERHIAYIFITHDLSIVPAIADDVLVMKEGKVVEYGSKERVLSSPSHPYTKQLLAAVPTLEGVV